MTYSFVNNAINREAFPKLRRCLTCGMTVRAGEILLPQGFARRGRDVFAQGAGRKARNAGSLRCLVAAAFYPRKREDAAACARIE